MKKMFYVLLTLSVTACGGEENTKKEKEEGKPQEEVTVMPPEEMLTPQDVESVFSITEGTSVELNDVSDKLGKIMEYKFQNIYPADSTTDADTADVKVVLDYLNPGKAKYKTHEEAIAFLENKIKNNPDDYQKIEFPFLAARTGTLYDLCFVYKNIIIKITGPWYKYSDDERFGKALELAHIVAKNLEQ